MMRMTIVNTRRDEEKASGISPEVDEIDVLLEELCEKEKDAESTSTNTAKKKDKEDKATAENMRLKAMESMGESQKRISDSTEEAPVKKSRKSIMKSRFLSVKRVIEVSRLVHI